MLNEMIDCHHHIWLKKDLAWLNGPMVPRIFGPYESIRRDYLIDEYVAEASSAGVTGSIYVQTNWPAGQEIAEVEWIQRVHDASRWPLAMVSYANLFDESAIGMLQRQKKASPLVKGTRIQLHWHENERYRFAAAPDTMRDPIFNRNIAALADMNLTFDLQVFPGQMQHAIELVTRHPDVKFVLVHAGMLESNEPQAVEQWLTGMREIAAHPNVFAKLTGQGTFVHKVDADVIAFVAREAIQAFSSKRLMWGSNFPIEKIWTDFGTLVAAWKDALSHETQDVQNDIFSGTAKTLYQL